MIHQNIWAIVHISVHINIISLHSDNIQHIIASNIAIQISIGVANIISIAPISNRNGAAIMSSIISILYFR